MGRWNSSSLGTGTVNLPASKTANIPSLQGITSLIRPVAGSPVLGLLRYTARALEDSYGRAEDEADERIS